jgi:hypothetical protein
MNKEFLTDEYRKKIQEYIKREKNIPYISYDNICNFLVDIGKIDKVEAAEVFSIIAQTKPTTFAHLPNCIWIKSTDDLLLFIESIYDEIKDNIAKAFVQISKEKNKNQEILEQKEEQKKKTINKQEQESIKTEEKNNKIYTFNLNWEDKKVKALYEDLKKIGEVDYEDVYYLITGRKINNEIKCMLLNDYDIRLAEIVCKYELYGKYSEYNKIYYNKIISSFVKENKGKNKGKHLNKDSFSTQTAKIDNIKRKNKK